MIMHSIKDSVSKFRSYLSWCGVFIVFDLGFLYVDIFLQGETGIFYVLAIRVLFHSIVVGWSEKIFAK